MVQASQGGPVVVLAEAGEGEEPGQDQARPYQRGQSPPQGLEAGADPALGRAQRHLEEGGDLLVRQVLEEGQAQRLALGRRQLRDGRAEEPAAVLVPGLLVGAGAGLGHAREAQALRVPFDAGTPATLPKLVDHAEVGDLQDPGTEGASRGSKVPALRQTATKTSWTTSSAVARSSVRAARSEDQRRVTAVERAERLLPAGGELAHQLLVAEARVQGRWRGVDRAHRGHLPISAACDTMAPSQRSSRRPCRPDDTR